MRVPFRQAWSRAGRDTVGFRPWIRGAFTAVLTAGLSAGALHFFGSPRLDLMKEVVLVGVAAVAALFLVPLGEFLWNLLWAPKRIESDRADAATAEADSLQRKLDAVVSESPRIEGVGIKNWAQGASLEVENVGAQGEFAAEITVLRSTFMGLPGKMRGFWEEGRSGASQIKNGHTDRLLLVAHKIVDTPGRPRGYGSSFLHYDGIGSNPRAAGGSGAWIPETESIQDFVDFEVRISTHPAMIGGPWIGRYRVKAGAPLERLE